VKEIFDIRTELGTWLKVECAFPVATGARARGIDLTQWRLIDRATYDQCIDPTDYRPAATTPPPPP